MTDAPVDAPVFTDGRYRLMLVRDGEPLISVDEMFVRLQQDLSQARAELEAAYQELGRLRIRSERANRAARAALGIGDDPEGRSGKPRLHLVPTPAPDGDG